MEPQFVNKVSELNKSKQTLIIPLRTLIFSLFKRIVFITSDDDTHTLTKKSKLFNVVFVWHQYEISRHTKSLFTP